MVTTDASPATADAASCASRPPQALVPAWTEHWEEKLLSGIRSATGCPKGTGSAPLFREVRPAALLV